MSEHIVTLVYPDGHRVIFELGSFRDRAAAPEEGAAAVVPPPGPRHASRTMTREEAAKQYERMRALIAAAATLDGVGTHAAHRAARECRAIAYEIRDRLDRAVSPGVAPSDDPM